MTLRHQDSLATPRYGYSYSKAYPAQKPPSNPLLTIISWLLLLAGLLLAVGIGGRALLAWRGRGVALHAVVIDSGSSGTRIYAYNWTQPSPGSSFPLVQPIPPSAAAHLVPKHTSKGMYNRVETRPGLDAFAANASGVSAALGPLLAWAQAVVPARAHASTPLFFMGTGGLRRLPAAQQQTLLAEVQKQLGQSGFRFEPSWARVISGDDEGAFGWLALNYQQGRLRPHSHSAATAAAGRGAAPASITSLGGLDLGGSSLQITFEVPPAAAPSSGSGSTKQGHSGAAAPAPPEYNISAAGHTFHLHLHSFKQYGLNEAYDRSITYLLQQQQEQQQLQKQQQNLEHEAQAAVEQVAQQAASTAAGNGTEAAGSTAPPAKPALSDSSSSGNASSGQPPAGLVDEQWQDAAAVGAAIQQHDLAVARAAGVPAADDADAAAGGDPAVHASSGDTQPAADVEHQRQVDLAAAAAAGFHHAPDAPEDALSTTADKDLDSLELSSSDARSTEHGLVPPSSSDGDASGLSSSTLQGSSSHAGLQPVARHSRSAPPHGADHWPVAQQDSSEGLASPGLRLQGRQQQQQPSAAAARRRASGRLRRSLMQQQLLWLDQLLGSAPQQLGSSSNSGRPGSGARSTLTVMSVQQQQQQQQQHSHDIRLRQLLTDYLLHDNLGPPPSVVSAANISSTEGSDNDSLAAARHPGRASSSRAAPLAAVQGHAAPLNSRSSSGNSSSKLQVVQHPCLHEGYEAAYTRLAFEGVTPEPAEVLLRGAPDWDSCIAVVNAVVNASAPCAVHEHLPACVLGTPQPELQGNFMALTGFYVVSRFLGVQGRHTLDPLLDAAKTLCAKPWPWVQQHLGSHVNVERYCTWAPYVVNLLLHGLGLEEHHVVIAQDGDLGWPLGAVLVEASKLPGFSTAAAAAAPAAGGKQQRQHRKHGPRSKHSSLRGAASVLQQAEAKGAAPTVADATPATAPVVGGLAPALQQHAASSQQAGPSWSLGLLHHNRPHAGLHLSGPGWVVVLVVAWSIIVAWCRGVCGPKAAGPVAFLPLTGIVSTAGPGRAQVSGYIGRAKVSPIRSFKNASL